MNYHIIVVKEALLKNSIDDNMVYDSVKIDWAKNNFDGIVLLKKKKSYDTIILHDIDPLLNSDQAISYIRNEIKSDINVIVSTNSLSKINDESLHIFYCKPEIKSILAQVENLERNSKQPPVYGLSYLLSVYGDEKEFIIESLRIFIRITENKILAMKDAMVHKDYQLIAEIAHNIKPSYQMILNDKSVVICNLLNNRESEEQTPHLINELYNEFKKIKKEIIYDFPKLE